MNIQSLILGLALATSLGSSAQASLVTNGSFEQSGYAAGSSPNIFNAGLITDWTLPLPNVSLPIRMPLPKSCTAPATISEPEADPRFNNITRGSFLYGAFTPARKSCRG